MMEIDEEEEEIIEEEEEECEPDIGGDYNDDHNIISQQPIIKTELKTEDNDDDDDDDLQTINKPHKQSKSNHNKWGEVRGSPYGSCHNGSNGDGNISKKKTMDETNEWNTYRKQYFNNLHFPVEGYDHVHGQSFINDIDEHPLGSINSKTKGNNNNNYDDDDDRLNSCRNNNYDQPIGSLIEKWRLVPYFLRLRSLLKQHIDSFNHFIDNEIQQIISSPSNNEIRSEHDPKFFMKYESCSIGNPSIEDESFSNLNTTPFQCRLRDCTYSAPIYVNVRYTRGRQIVVKRNVVIGRLPIMLRSNRCILHNKTNDELASYQECPYDPGGYFIVKGVEKVILIQEQLSKNRVILEEDNSSSSTAAGSGVSATITSSTHERKSKAYIILKHGRVYLKSNSLGEDIPIIIVLKAMGIESDIEIVQLIVGSDNESYLIDALALSLEESFRYRIYTQIQALRYIGTKITQHTSSNPNSNTNSNNDSATSGGANNNNPIGGGPGNNNNYRKNIPIEDEAREVLANVVLSHIPVYKFNFRPKAIYIGNIVRRVLLVHLKKMSFDDKDYYGNKRLELAGALISLLFEDLFKLFNSHLKRQTDMVLSKPNRAQAYDIIKSIRSDTITNGMITAIATGNWILKRFRMDRAGVTQVLSRLSYMSALGMMTRINSQFEKTRKVSGPRSLQASQWGMLCPADTPEGEACGLVKNLALLSHITTDTDHNAIQSIERLCYDLGVEDITRLTGNELHHSNNNNDSKNKNKNNKDENTNKKNIKYGHGGYIVFLNGLLLGIHTKPIEFVNNLRKMRRGGLCGEFVSVYLHTLQNAVHIATDGGRVCRPLIIVDDITNLPKLKQYHLESLASGIITIKDLLQQGVVEYVDCNEENNTLIALTERDLEYAIKHNNKLLIKQQLHAILQQQKEAFGPSAAMSMDSKNMINHETMIRYTHLEVDPFTILGVIGGIIPYPHHNQAPRNTYTVAMAKQAMGTIGINAYERMDGLIYTKVYPQKPMIKSRTLDILNFDQIPGGQNACIAVMSYSGYDIEDAIVINKAAIDRGYGRCMVLKKYQTSVRKYANGTMDRTCSAPNPNEFPDGINDKRYQKFIAIDQDGICRVGEKLDNGTFMVNKESPIDTTSNLGIGIDFGLGTSTNHTMMNHHHNIQYKPSGMTYRSSAPAYVDKVVITCNEHTSLHHESFLIKIMTRQVRRPEIGDKFASRHGQKGVCGLIVPQEDMPFNEYGQVPDLIMNPHGFPSRMTIGKLLELVVGKAGLFEGRQGYSTAFGEEHGSADTHESASECLIQNGYNYQGKDILYSGTNGEPLNAYIFSGPVFYQKLKHMVLDKAHARARGPRAVLTRQPTEGRSRDGGLRLGEMERDCLIAYGVSNLIMERLMYSSDAFLASVCLTCGLLQYHNWCQYCRSGEQVTNIRLPYACKLLFQELQSMNVLPRLRLEDHS